MDARASPSGAYSTVTRSGVSCATSKYCWKFISSWDSSLITIFWFPHTISSQLLDYWSGLGLVQSHSGKGMMMLGHGAHLRENSIQWRVDIDGSQWLSSSQSASCVSNIGKTLVTLIWMLQEIHPSIYGSLGLYFSWEWAYSGSISDLRRDTLPSTLLNMDHNSLHQRRAKSTIEYDLINWTFEQWEIF